MHSMKVYGKVEVQLHLFVNSALHKVLRTAPRHFIPVDRAPVTHLIGRWVGPRAMRTILGIEK